MVQTSIKLQYNVLLLNGAHSTCYHHNNHRIESSFTEKPCSVSVVVLTPKTCTVKSILLTPA